MPIRKIERATSGGVENFNCKLADAPNLKTDPASADAGEGSTVHIIDARDIAKMHDGQWISMKDGVTVYGE